MRPFYKLFSIILWSRSSWSISIGNILLFWLIILIRSLNAKLIRCVTSNWVKSTLNFLFILICCLHAFTRSFAINWNRVTNFALGKGLKFLITRSTSNWFITFFRTIKFDTFRGELFVRWFYPSIFRWTKCFSWVIVTPFTWSFFIATPFWPMWINWSFSAIYHWYVIVFVLYNFQLSVKLLNIMIKIVYQLIII